MRNYHIFLNLKFFSLWLNNFAKTSHIIFPKEFRQINKCPLSVSIEWSKWFSSSRKISRVGVFVSVVTASSVSISASALHFAQNPRAAFSLFLRKIKTSWLSAVIKYFFDFSAIWFTIRTSAGNNQPFKSNRFRLWAVQRSALWNQYLFFKGNCLELTIL